MTLLPKNMKGLKNKNELQLFYNELLRITTNYY